jgi:Mycoplasma protein of unknown function, DUF285
MNGNGQAKDDSGTAAAVSVADATARPHPTKYYEQEELLSLLVLHQQFLGQQEEQGPLLLYALSFLDVATLLQKQTVSKEWKDICTRAIDLKCSGQGGPQSFQSPEDLQKAIETYWMKEASSMEVLACTYGYPIKKWKVSRIDAMTCFYTYPIHKLDASGITNDHLFSLFQGFGIFDDDVSSWDVSNVTDMSHMFYSPPSFHEINGSWDVSNVTADDYDDDDDDDESDKEFN